jgi:hypothetical protein
VDARRNFGDEASIWVRTVLGGFIAWVAYSAGKNELARLEGRRCVDAARAMGSPTLLAGALSVFSHALCEAAPEEALSAADESAGLVEAGAGDAGSSGTLQDASMIRTINGDYVGAARAVLAAIEHEAATGVRTAMAMNVVSAVIVLSRLAGELEAAAMLDGAVTGPVLSHAESLVDPFRRQVYESGLVCIAEGLGEAKASEARRGGARMPYDEIVTFAIDTLRRIVLNARGNR